MKDTINSIGIIFAALLIMGIPILLACSFCLNWHPMIQAISVIAALIELIFLIILIMNAMEGDK